MFEYNQPLFPMSDIDKDGFLQPVLQKYRPLLPQYTRRRVSRHLMNTHARSRFYSTLYRTRIVVDFDKLHKEFPDAGCQFENSGGAPGLTFNSISFIRVADDLQIFNIRGKPALSFKKVNSTAVGLGGEKYREIHLHTVHKFWNDYSENIKRLTLRHLGFEAVRYNGKTKITFNTNNSLIMKKNEDNHIQQLGFSMGRLCSGTMVGAVIISNY